MNQTGIAFRFFSAFSVISVVIVFFVSG